MFSALKFVAAAAIVALFGGLLLTGLLSTPQESEVLPAAVTESPAPTTTEELVFPTGRFEAEEDGLTLELRGDGTCQRPGVACAYGVRGDLFSEMTFEDPSGAQVPATYSWDFDGEHLTFELHGEDRRPGRQEVYADHTYRLVEADEPLAPTSESGFPTGAFVPADAYVPPDGNPLVMRFTDDGSYSGGGWVGTYAVNGDLYTEMTLNYDTVAQVPATYRWRWDGEQLRFSLWGEDANRWRTDFYGGRAYVRDTTPVLPQRLQLPHRDLDFWVTIEIVKGDDGRYEATASADGDPLGEGVGDTKQEAVLAALQSLGEPIASEIAEKVEG